MHLKKRGSGVLLHVTSLPSRYGIGDLGKSAYEFIDFLVEAKQSYWQVLPINQTGYGDSPYQCLSAFAGNVNLISLDKLVEIGLLEQIGDIPDFPDKVDFVLVTDFKKKFLRSAFENFKRQSNFTQSFEAFCYENGYWLEDYALYRAIKSSQGERSWQDWSDDLRLREDRAIEKARKELSESILEQKFYQFIFFKQWKQLKAYANQKGVKIIGDVPIFVALDSADVWCNQRQFKLNEDGSPKVLAGVPPDYFSKTGQLWGNPIYNWDRMLSDSFSWWRSRIGFNLQIFDVLRIDHFRGFVAIWEVPAAETTAENGRWVESKGFELFSVLKQSFGELPIIVEDLGFITPEVEKLRDAFGFPGMKILQYAWSSDAKNSYLPHNYSKNCVVYPGTHDNDTVVGWFSSLASDKEREFCLKYLNSDGSQIHWDLIRASLSSVAFLSIFQMQDLLGLGSEARMNIPATKTGNWQWRCENFPKTVAQKLGEMTEIYGRCQS
ncbi:MAG: 4-alpha-glucanotransferase [Acidobacteriota bacterium]|nr:4-alpha-glucanotransferase [Pyrinomonadaceae bacterium]MDW8303776.1 4-alpha-glucanotransferase [Acidobacteriota bacterium]